VELTSRSEEAMKYQTAFITGASSGLGKHIALELARRGCSVGLLARRAEMLESLAAEVRGLAGAGGGLRVAVAAGDVADRQSQFHALARLRDELGTPDLVIANAGVGISVLAQGMEREEALDATEQTMRVNLLGALTTIYATLPWLLEARRGQLVAVSSLAAYRSFPGSNIYCASKAGLSSAMEGLRVELRGTGVGVTTICPGFVRTPMTDQNDFDMQFMVEPERAAALMVSAMERRKRVYAFPWQMNLIVRGLLRHMPNWLFDRIVGRAAGKRKAFTKTPSKAK
jgi:short-subunit dehydrogenase